MIRLILSFFVLMLFPLAAHSNDRLDLSGYQQESGAITTNYKGNTIDPYFATKALLLADDSGMDIKKNALAWIDWAIKMQRADGLFERYEYNNSKNDWESYAAADADDAMLALWLELLNRMSPDSGVPGNWKDSLEKSEARLSEIYDSEKGVYNISTTLPVALLMDNTEIYSAFKNIANEQKRLGNEKKVHEYENKASRLSKNIIKVFRLPDGTFLSSVQTRNDNSFYPGKVAQLYPLLYELPYGADDKSVYNDWINANGKEWLSQKDSDYPWGLVAITALKMGDKYSALCWQNHAEPMRYGKHWNVLEEVALQNVKSKLNSDNETKIACVGGNLQ